MTDATASAAPRRRDPERRQRILAAAAELVAERGYHEVGMSDIEIGRASCRERV